MLKAFKGFFIFSLVSVIIFLLVHFFDFNSYKTSSFTYNHPSEFYLLDFKAFHLKTENFQPSLKLESDVLVKIKSCSLKKDDFGELYCNGFAGIVVDTGKESKVFENGAKVLGQLPIIYRYNLPEYISISEDMLIFKPISLNFFQAALVANFIDGFYYGINFIKETIDQFDEMNILIDDLNSPEAEMIGLFLNSFNHVKLHTFDFNDLNLIKKLGIHKENIININQRIDFKFDVLYNFNKKINISSFISNKTKVLNFNLKNNHELVTERLSYIAELAHDGHIPLFVDQIFALKDFNAKKRKFDFINDNIVVDINGKN